MSRPVVDRFHAALAARSELERMADEHAALRRVAELVARGESQATVFDAVALEAWRLLGGHFTALLRYEPDGSAVIVAMHGAEAVSHVMHVGMRLAAEGDGVVQRVQRSARAARIDSYTDVPGWNATTARDLGLTGGVGAPIVTEGRVWGAITVLSRQPLPPTVETRLAQFAELVATAIANAQARSALRALAAEQAALRRAAEVVARAPSLEEVFAAVATAASSLLGGRPAALLRYDADGLATNVAACGTPGGAAVAVPIVVDGSVWGTLSTSKPLRVETQDRLTEFAELAGAAIANAENKAELTASRARVVATADETRRRLQRDVHDAAQQRLVYTIITLKLARDAIAAGGDAGDLVSEALAVAERADRDLRDVVHGILPASLTRGGLPAGLESLTFDLPIPVDLRVTTPRQPAQIETTAFFVVAEALTNVVKHAGASRAWVAVAVENGSLSIEVRDDGAGGADPALGTGLTGLLDRIEANDGTLTVTSPRGSGTTLHATLPLDA